MKRAVFVVGLIVFDVHLAFAQIEFTKQTITELFEGVHAFRVADLNADGTNEVIGASLDAIIIWRNSSGAEASWVADTVSNSFEGARFVDAADVDGDGDVDLFGAAKDIDTVTWWENDGGDANQWIEHIVDDAFDFAIHVFAKDLDGDNDMDLLGAALKDDAITWWENSDGVGGSWVKHIIDDNFNGARHVCVIDIDRDGDLDIVGSADLDDTIAWWENTGDIPENWVKHIVDDSFNGVNSVFPVDFDGDGYQDLLGVADASNEIAWWRNVPGETTGWERKLVQENFDGAVSVYPVDFDGDNDIDILGAAAIGDIVAWWENTSGDGQRWNAHIIEEVFDAPSFVIANDFDKDGDVDALVGTLKGSPSEKGAIVWWKNESLLPVELASFEALVNGSNVYLTWQTLSELNNSGFEVQYRSEAERFDGADGYWTTLTFIEGQGTTLDPVEYTFDAGQFEYGTHLFRLRQIDFDGGFSYSDVVQVAIGLQNGLTMTAPYPNPFNPQTHFSLHVPVSQRVSINVYNTLGQRVGTIYDGLLDPGSFHQFDFQAAGLPGGLYMIRVLGDHFAESRQVLLIK